MIEKIKKIPPKKILAIAFIVVGIAAILAVIAIPVYNSWYNNNLMNKIKETAKETKSPVGTEIPIVSDEAAELSGDGIEPGLSEEEQALDAIEEQKKKWLQERGVIGIVEIEKIGVRYAILEGTGDEVLNKTIGHLTGSAMIGEKGNCVITGHRGGVYGTFFEHLDKIVPGDLILLTDYNGKEYQYVVYDTKIIESWDWSVTETLNNEKTATFLTCEEDTKKRIAVSTILSSK